MLVVLREKPYCSPKDGLQLQKHNFSQKALYPCRVCKCVTLYQVFASRHNVNALSLRNFLSKHICIMHTVLLPFFCSHEEGVRTSESLQSTPCHFGTLRNTEGFHVCVQACLESKPKWRIVSLDSPIISNNYVDPAHFLSLRNRYQVLSNFLLCCGLADWLPHIASQQPNNKTVGRFLIRLYEVTCHRRFGKAKGKWLLELWSGAGNVETFFSQMCSDGTVR